MGENAGVTRPDRAQPTVRGADVAEGLVSLALLTWWAGPYLGYWSHGEIARWSRWLPLVVLVPALRSVRPTLLAIGDAAPLVALLAWAGLSRWWSIAPSSSRAKTADLTIALLLGAYLGARWTRAQLLALVAGALTAGAALSVVAIQRTQYPWRTQRIWGAYLHPNFLGHASALGVVLTVLLACRRTRTSPLWALAAAVHLGLLLRSESDGGQMVLAGTAVVTAIVAARPVARRLGRPVHRLWIAATTTTAAMAVLVGVFNERALRLAGQDPTLTGRRDVWRAIWPFVERRPLAGYGFWAMWTGARGYAARIAEGWTYGVVPHAHNAFLEMAVGLGAVGFVLFVAALGLAGWRAAAGIDRHPGVVGAWPVAFLVAMICTSLVESVAVFPPSVYLTVLCALCVRERAAPDPAAEPVAPSAPS